jgi:hypothetical protein
MINGHIARYAFGVAILFFLVIAVTQTGAALTAFSGAADNQRAVKAEVEQETFAQIEKALRIDTGVHAYAFSGDYPDPLRAYRAVVRRRAATPAGPSYTRTELTLKGVLAKENPLAIIQDQGGKTHICKVGDAVDEQEVIAIQEDMIRVRDRLGAYELTVKER